MRPRASPAAAWRGGCQGLALTAGAHAAPDGPRAAAAVEVDVDHHRDRPPGVSGGDRGGDRSTVLSPAARDRRVTFATERPVATQALGAATGSSSGDGGAVPSPAAPAAAEPQVEAGEQPETVPPAAADSGAQRTPAEPAPEPEEEAANATARVQDGGEALVPAEAGAGPAGH